MDNQLSCKYWLKGKLVWLIGTCPFSRWSWCLALWMMTASSPLCVWSEAAAALLSKAQRKRDGETEGEREGGKTSLNVGCCVIPPRAPLLFLCLGLHVTVGYFLWWLARINRSSNVHPVGQRLHSWWVYSSLISFVVILTRTWAE